MPITLDRPEISSFITAWQRKPKEQVAEELASFSLETKRIPDPYHFIVSKGGELLSPTAHCRIKDTVEDKTSHLGYLEYQAVRSIEQWAAKGSEGAIAWVSPPYPGVYPTSKIIISEIGYDGDDKKLFNRAIVLDFDEKQCLEFAQQLVQYSQDRPLLSHLDQIRSTPIALSSRIPWMRILEELIDDPALWDSIRKGEDLRAKKEAIREATRVQKDFFATTKPYTLPSDETQMVVLQMLGSKGGSCPSRITGLGRTPLSVFSEGSLKIGGGSSGESLDTDQYGDLEFECPTCKQTNRRPKGKLIPNCQHCSADVRC